MKSILIVGCGGIGSYLVESLSKLYKYYQLLDVDITIADSDTVDTKNLSYQNFVPGDLLDNKAEVLGNRYDFLYLTRDISKDDFESFDLVVSAVDNSILRRELFLSNVDWIDLRCSGKSCVFYTKHPKNTKEKMLGTLPKNDVSNSSCQLKFELDNGIVQMGNKIIANIGAQLILNWVRGQKNSAEFSYMF